MKRKQKAEGVLGKASEAFDLPGEILTGMPRIEITGCRRVMVENHKGILEYGHEEIDVNGGKVIVKIRGQELELRSMNADELLITGLIFGVDFEF